jgi:hypothetical protein
VREKEKTQNADAKQGKPSQAAQTPLICSKIKIKITIKISA